MKTLANWIPRLKVNAMAVTARLKALAPYALIELIMPGGSVMALLLWLYRRRKSLASNLLTGAP
jgi:hypothetical protein